MEPERPLGAHVSATRDNGFGLGRMAELGITCGQIFGSNKMQWRPRKFSDEQVAAFHADANSRAVGPVFSHGIYLTNFGAREANSPVWQRSITATVAGLEICDRLGLAGLVVHLGSNYGLGFDAVIDSVVEALTQVLADHRGKSRLVLENSAGSARVIGGRFSEFGRIIGALDDDDRLAICLDTAHAFAFGYDLCSEDGRERMAEEFVDSVGAERLALLHVNDSKVECGRLLDRHANLGEGLIGLDGIAATINHPLMAGTPMVLETPGFDGQGPDIANLTLLRIAAGMSDADPKRVIEGARAGQ